MQDKSTYGYSAPDKRTHFPPYCLIVNISEIDDLTFETFPCLFS